MFIKTTKTHKYPILTQHKLPV